MKKTRGNSKYHEWITEDGCLKIEGWARDGLTNGQISHNIGITSETLRVWSNKYPSISAALKRGKEVVDIQVENALLKRALGYEYEEVKMVVEKDEKGNEKKRQEKVIKKVVPDVTAQIFWLKNRKPDVWSDNPTELGKEEQLARIAKLKAQTETIKGIKSDIEDTRQLHELIFGDK